MVETVEEGSKLEKEEAEKWWQGEARGGERLALDAFSPGIE